MIMLAGPPSLIDSSRLACQEVSPLVQKIGKRGIPGIPFVAHSFEL